MESSRHRVEANENIIAQSYIVIYRNHVSNLQNSALTQINHGESSSLSGNPDMEGGTFLR